jgi:hypothetical protein
LASNPLTSDPRPEVGQRREGKGGGSSPGGARLRARSGIRTPISAVTPIPSASEHRCRVWYSGLRRGCAMTAIPTRSGEVRDQRVTSGGAFSANAHRYSVLPRAPTGSTNRDYNKTRMRAATVSRRARGQLAGVD